MIIRELIAFLKVKNQDQVVSMGFKAPHTYHGDHYELAFVPAKNVTVGSMLACVKEALTGDYTEHEVNPYTYVYLAKRHCCGEEIGLILLKYMLREYR